MVLVHQEADGAAVHAVDRHLVVDVPVQGLQHETVAAERHDGIRRSRVGVAVEFSETLARLLSFRHVAGDESDPLEFGLQFCHDGLAGMPSNGCVTRARG